MYLADNEGRYIMTKILYLMRHGQTLFNARGKIQGACDSPLTELGIQQAQHAARKVSKNLTMEPLREKVKI